MITLNSIRQIYTPIPRPEPTHTPFALDKRRDILEHLLLHNDQSIGDIYRTANIGSPTLKAQLQWLEQRGFITNKRVGSNSRNNNLRAVNITPAGVRYLTTIRG